MKEYRCGEIEQAIAHAAGGGQALHLHRLIVDTPDHPAPDCFVREVKEGRDIAHLFDRDVARLVKTARRLGVKVVVVERRGREGQHVDLCGAPLRKAVRECDEAAAVPTLFEVE